MRQKPIIFFNSFIFFEAISLALEFPLEITSSKKDVSFFIFFISEEIGEIFSMISSVSLIFKSEKFLPEKSFIVSSNFCSLNDENIPSRFSASGRFFNSFFYQAKGMSQFLLFLSCLIFDHCCQSN